MATTSSVATGRAPRVAAILTVAAVAAGLVAVALLRRPEPSGAGGVAPPAGAPRPPPRPEASVDISQITVIYGVATGDRRGTDRSKTEALEIARRALARIAAGEAFERVMADLTDDRNEVGKPFNDGSYTIARSTPTAAVVKQVAFGTPVGLVHPEPIDTGVAFVVLRRDR